MQSVIGISSSSYRVPLANVIFNTGEIIYTVLPTDPYNVYPYDGTVIGELPPNILNIPIGSTITIPSLGNLQRAERRIIIFTNGQRVAPDPLTFQERFGWSDGERMYLPGDQYTISKSDINFYPNWSAAWVSSGVLTGGSSTTSASPGQKIQFYYRTNNSFESFPTITKVEFRGRINGSTGGTSSITYPVTNYNLIDADVLEVTVPEIPTTSNYFLGGSVNRFGTLVHIERSSTYDGRSRAASIGSTNINHRFITIV